MADKIQSELVGLYHRAGEIEIKVEQEEFMYSFEESVVEVVEMPDIEWKEPPKKSVKREQINIFESLKEDGRAQRNTVTPFKLSRKPNYSKVDKDAG